MLHYGYSGGGIRTRDLRVMSLDRESCWATWGTVSSGFRKSSSAGIGWNMWGFLPHFLPQKDPRRTPRGVNRNSLGAPP